MISSDKKNFVQNPSLPCCLLTDQEATKYLGLAKGTLNLWRHLGKGPRYFKVGRCVRYSLTDIMAYLENQRSNH